MSCGEIGFGGDRECVLVYVLETSVSSSMVSSVPACVCVYICVSVCVSVCDCQGFDDGVGTLVQSSLCQFPFMFDEPVNLLIALTKAGCDSALQVNNKTMSYLHSFDQ